MKYPLKFGRWENFLIIQNNLWIKLKIEMDEKLHPFLLQETRTRNHYELQR